VLATGSWQDLLRVQLHEPLAFLGNPNETPQVETTTQAGCFLFAGVPTPTSGLGALATLDPAGTSPQVLELVATYFRPQSGQSYQVDVYAFPRSILANGWPDIEGTGGTIAYFYDQPVPDQTHLSIASDTRPVAGVQIDGADGGALYFDPDRVTLSTRTSTGPVGGCIFLGIPSSAHGGSCTGGPCDWGVLAPASIPHVISIRHFHNCALSPTALGCQ
jgi:hypothetical protein